MSDKQFVGLYAVGGTYEESPAPNFVERYKTTAVFIGKLGMLPSEARFDVFCKHPLASLRSAQVGLYIGIVTVTAGCHTVNIIPLSLAHEAKLQTIIDPVLLPICLNSIERVIGGDSGEGEPTPSYVNQDPS